MRWLYHVVEEVDGPVEGLANAGDMLEPLGAAVVLVDLVDGEAGRGDGEARQHAHAHQDVEDPLDAAGRKLHQSGGEQGRRRWKKESTPAALALQMLLHKFPPWWTNKGLSDLI